MTCTNVIYERTYEKYTVKVFSNGRWTIESIVASGYNEGDYKAKMQALKQLGKIVGGPFEPFEIAAMIDGIECSRIIENAMINYLKENDIV